MKIESNCEERSYHVSGVLNFQMFHISLMLVYRKYRNKFYRAIENEKFLVCLWKNYSVTLMIGLTRKLLKEKLDCAYAWKYLLLIFLKSLTVFWDSNIFELKLACNGNFTRHFQALQVWILWSQATNVLLTETCNFIPKSFEVHYLIDSNFSYLQIMLFMFHHPRMFVSSLNREKKQQQQRRSIGKFSP